MKLKRWIIASCICIFPLFILGVCNPIITLMIQSKKHDLGSIRADLFLIYVGILAICISIITTTLVGISRYTSYIDKLDKKDKDLDEEWQRVQNIRRNYEKLIANAKGSTIHAEAQSGDSTDEKTGR
jgi:uncharacterized membrane protein YqhA